MPTQDQGENREGHHCELECQRSAQEPTLLNSVQGENLEDHENQHDPELNGQRSAPQYTANLALRENREAITTTRNWIVNDLLGKVLPEQGRRPALLDSVMRDLGHVDNLLGQRGVQEPEELRQLVPHLRNRSIEILHVGTDIDGVLRHVPLNPFLRSPPLTQTRRLGTAGLFLILLEELWLGMVGLPELGPVLLLVTLSSSPGPGGLAPWSAVPLRTVMCGSEQGHEP